MLMDLLHGFEVLSTTEETLFNSRNVSRLVQNNFNTFISSIDFYSANSFGPINQSINFLDPLILGGIAGAAAQVGASKHLDPLQQRIDALLGCQGETN